MSEKNKFDVDEVLEMIAFRSKINALYIRDIVWTRGGKEIKLNEQAVDKYSMIGLNTIDIFMMSLDEEERA